MFGLGDKMTEYLQLAIGLACIVVVGLLLIKVLLRIVRKTLKKTTLDESMHVFIASAIKIQLMKNRYNAPMKKDS